MLPRISPLATEKANANAGLMPFPLSILNDSGTRQGAVLPLISPDGLDDEHREPLRDVLFG